MTRNIKALGFAVLAVLATSAVVASAAQAEGNVTFTANNGIPGSYTVTGEQIPHVTTGGQLINKHVITATGREISCAKTVLDGTVEAQQTKLTLTPTSENCKAGLLAATYTHNGCHYVLYGGVQTPGNIHHFENGTMDIVCPPGQAMEIHIYSSPANHAAGISLCTITILPQQGLKANTYTNTTPLPDDVDITTDVDVKAHVHGPVAACGPTEQIIKYEGGTTLRAYQDPAHFQQVNLTVLPHPLGG